MVAPHYFPRHHCEKTYLVTLESPVADERQSNLLKACSCITKKISLSRGAGSDYPNAGSSDHQRRALHQVKRMFAAVGNHVVELHRDVLAVLRWMLI